MIRYGIVSGLITDGLRIFNGVGLERRERSFGVAVAVANTCLCFRAIGGSRVGVCLSGRVGECMYVQYCISPYPIDHHGQFL